MTLNEVKIGDTVKVLNITCGDISLRRRLMEMGLCNNTNITVVRKSPLGDPLEILLLGYHLILRKEQAQYIIVQ